MKLYTEEQIKQAIKNGYLNFFDDTNRLNLLAQEYVNSLTPIELPSDEEIEDVAWDSFIGDSAKMGFAKGAKWVIDKIKNNS